MINKFAPALAGLLMLTGCGGSSYVGRPDLTLVEGNALPPPTRSDMQSAALPYLIGAGDKLNLDVYGVEEMKQTILVDTSGVINVPLIGSVDAAGRTATELSAAIADRLRGRFIRNPHVTVNVEEANQTVTVDGEVGKPGQYPVVAPMTLMRTVALASGASEFADTTFVVVFRKSNGQEMAALYDLRAIRAGAYPDPKIYAHDVIFVGESAGRRTFQTLIQGSGLILAPLIAVINRN